MHFASLETVWQTSLSFDREISNQSQNGNDRNPLSCRGFPRRAGNARKTPIFLIKFKTNANKGQCLLGEIRTHGGRYF